MTAGGWQLITEISFRGRGRWQTSRAAPQVLWVYQRSSDSGILLIGGYKFESQPGVANLDAAAEFFELATGVTPAMDTQIVGLGSLYPWTATDAKNNPFDGGKNYRLHLPPNIPVKDFWSVIVYDTQTRSMLQTNQQFPSVSSQKKNLLVNADGSVDGISDRRHRPVRSRIGFKPFLAKGWWILLRLYGPLKPLFKQTWRPDDIELMP